ncbi:conserved hypothetical protein [Vibrio owensii]|uniref:Class IIb bacteriocin, lactobin A/cerein 7B family n=1 Tax=Vibrio owensii TaxID=696485 RepID=A0AAU9PZF7_9VIBR|nr:conserved hypothetical protein [Vibrio owensii]
MEVLNIVEMEEVSGGLPPAVGVAVNVAAGIAGAYIYDALGGKQGIDSAASSGWSTYKVFMADSALRLSHMR